MRIAFLALFICFFLSFQIYAQEEKLIQTKGLRTIEGFNEYNRVLSPAIGGAYLGYTYYYYDYANLYGCKVRKFLTEKIAGRVSISGGFNSRLYSYYDYPNAKSNKLTAGNINLKIGIEKHFSETKRLSPYFGTDLNFAYSNVKGDLEADDLFTFNRRTYQKLRAKGFGISALGFIGTDYYLAKNFFMGTELGISLYYNRLKRSLVSGESKETASTLYSDRPEPEYGFSFTPSGLIRIGFGF